MLVEVGRGNKLCLARLVRRIINYKVHPIERSKVVIFAHKRELIRLSVSRSINVVIRHIRYRVENNLILVDYNTRNTHEKIEIVERRNNNRRTVDRNEAMNNGNKNGTKILSKLPCFYHKKNIFISIDSVFYSNRILITVSRCW